MRSHRSSLLVVLTILALLVETAALYAGRGGGRGGGGGSRGGGGHGGGSFSRSSGGGHSGANRSASRPSSSGGNRSASRPSNSGGGTVKRDSGGGGRMPSSPAQRPSAPAQRPSNPPQKPAGPAQRPAGSDRPASNPGISQLPSGNRPSQPTRPSNSRPGTPNVPEVPSTRPAPGNRPQVPNRPSEGPGAGNRPGSPGVSDLPANRPGTANRPDTRPSQRPSKSDLGNFLGVTGGVAGGAAVADRMADHRPGGGEQPWRPDQGPGHRPDHALRPEDRANWNDWSQNRGDHWEQRVDSRHDAWNQRADNREQARNDWQQHQDERWNNIENAREDRQNWRDQNREDWQQHREDLWDYRGDRAEEIRDNARDFYDDVFDDRWWGACGWGAWVGHYPANPWWWWRRPVAWAPVASFVGAIVSDPVYIDYGVNVIFEDDEDVVYVDSQPVPAAEYVQPVSDLAANVEQPPPPLPSGDGAAVDEWMPLGVFALAQEEKGDPVMFFQISVNRDGVVSGAYNNTITGDERPIAGQVDKKTQHVAWRIGDNAETVFETSLGNLTQDVSPIAVHFGAGRTQTWLLVSMPEPSDKPAGIPPVNAKPPPLAKAAVPKA